MKDIQKLVLDFIRAIGSQKLAGKFFGKSRQVVGHWSREYSAPERFLLVEILHFLRQQGHVLYVSLGIRECERLLGFSLQALQAFILSFEPPSTQETPEAKALPGSVFNRSAKEASGEEGGWVSRKFWIQPAMQALSCPARLVAVYLMTGGPTALLGCFQCSRGSLAEALHLSGEAIRQSLEDLLRVGFLHYDEQSCWMWVTPFLDWNPIENSAQAQAIESAFDRLPLEMPFLSQLAEKLRCQFHLRPCFLERLEHLLQKSRAE